MFMLAASSLVVLGIGSDVVADTGMPVSEVGLLVTAFALPYAILAPLFQLFCGGRLGARTIIVAGALLLCFGLLLTGVAQHKYLLLFARGLTATGAALLAPAALATATFLVSAEERGRAIAAVYLGFTLASVIGVPLGTQMAQLFDWRSTFFFFAIAALIAAVFARVVLPDLAPANALPLNVLLRLVRERQLQFVLGAAIMQLAAQFMLLAPMAPILLFHFGLAPELLPGALLLFGLAGVLGNHLGGSWSDRMPLGFPLRASVVGLAAALLALTWPLDGYIAVAAFALLAFFGTVFRPPQIVLLTKSVSADQRSLAIGLNMSASYVGLTIGSAASATVATGFGYSALGWGALAFLIVAALLVELAKRVGGA